MALRSFRRLTSSIRPLSCVQASSSSVLDFTYGQSVLANTSSSCTLKKAYESPFHRGQSQWRQFHFSALLGAPINVLVPSMGESISEGVVAAILKNPGDIVREGDVIVQLETDKVTIDVKYMNKEAGTMTVVAVKEQDTVAVGQTICTVEAGGVSEEAPPPPIEEKKAAPKVEKAAVVPGPAPKAPRAKATPPPVESTSQPNLRPERRVKMTRLRLRVAERLKGAQNTYAMLTTFNEIDMSGIMELRNAYKDEFVAKHGVKLGFMSVFVKAAADALQTVPSVNAVIDKDEIIYRDYYDISIAVATQKGLVVPVLRGVDDLSIADVERTINELGKKARDGTISIDDMAGGTFTISNGGVYGSMLSTPIINPPQSAILGMHNIVQRATVINGKIEVRPIMYVALTYDHRLIDGREAVMFLKRIKEIVEDPRRLVLDV